MTRVVATGLTVGMDVGHRRPGPRGGAALGELDVPAGRLVYQAIVGLSSQLEGAGFTPERTTGSLRSGVTSGESFTR